MSELVELLSRGYAQDFHVTLDEVNRAREILSNSPECASDVTSGRFATFFDIHTAKDPFGPCSA